MSTSTGLRTPPATAMAAARLASASAGACVTPATTVTWTMPSARRRTLAVAVARVMRRVSAKAPVSSPLLRPDLLPAQRVPVEHHGALRQLLVGELGDAARTQPAAQHQAE